MKTTVIGTRLLVPTLICATALLSATSSATRQSGDAVSSGLAMRVADTPLLLNAFDRTALQSAAVNANLTGSSITASLVGPERLALPRAGGTTTVTLAVQGLSLFVQPVSLPSGISVSLSGNQLTVASTANRGTLERVGTFAITAQGGNNPLSGRVRGVLMVGVSQLPCTATTCPATGTAAPVSITMAPTTRVAGIDWSALASSMRGRNADAILVAIDGSDTASRTSGASITRLAQLCAANGFKCILELSSSNASPSAYFTSPDVHAALYGAETQLILSLRGESNLEGNSGAITQLRSAGLGHTLLVAPLKNASRALASDPHRNTLIAADTAKAAATNSASASTATLLVPQAVIATAPLVPVDFEINGQAFVVDRSLVPFDAAGGSADLRFLQSGGLRWSVRKVPNSFVQGGSTFPQSGQVTLSVSPSTTTRSERVEFSAKTASGAVTLFIAVAVVQDADGSVF